MLQTLRNNTRVILWIIVIAFIGFIILVWGADLQVGSGREGMVGEVNGQSVSYQDYQRRVTANLQRLRAQSDREVGVEEERAAIAQTWETIVSEILITQEARKDPLPLSDGEVLYWIRSNPPDALRQEPSFVDSTGQFDLARYQEALRQAPEQFDWYEAFVRTQLPVSKLQQNVLSAAKVSQAEIDAYVRDRHEQMRASYVWVNPGSFTEADAQVSETEARAYYEAHPDEFRVGERARLVVARVPKEASPQDEADAIEEVRGYASTIRKGEASFADIAGSFSQNAFAEQGGDHGRPVFRSEIDTELAEQVFSLPVGQVSEPFRMGKNGMWIIQVTADTLIDGKPARRFSSIERRIEPGAERLTELRDRVQEIRTRAERGGLATAALAAGVKVDTTALFERNAFNPLLMGIREAAEFAFEKPVGTLAGPVETATDFVLYQVTEKREAEIQPFDEVLANVQRKVQRARQHELARAEAQKLYNAFQSAGNLAAAAKSVNLTVRESPRFNRKGGIPGVSRDPELIAGAFALRAGETSNLIEAPSGFFIVHADSLFPVTGEELQRQRDMARQMVERERQTQVFEAWMEDLRAHADIEDRREQAF
jgi:hypothetical protein